MRIVRIPESALAQLVTDTCPKCNGPRSAVVYFTREPYDFDPMDPPVIFTPIPKPKPVLRVERCACGIICDDKNGRAVASIVTADGVNIAPLELLVTHENESIEKSP